MPKRVRYRFVLVIHDRVNNAVLVEQQLNPSAQARLPSLGFPEQPDEATWSDFIPNILRTVSSLYRLHTHVVAPLWDSDLVSTAAAPPPWMSTVVLHLELAHTDSDDLAANTEPHSPEPPFNRDTPALGCHAPLLRFWTPFADALADAHAWQPVSQLVTTRRLLLDAHALPPWEQPWRSANFTPDLRAWVRASLNLAPADCCLRLVPVHTTHYGVTYRASYWPRGGTPSATRPAVAAVVVGWARIPEPRVTLCAAGLAQGFVPLLIAVDTDWNALISQHDPRRRPPPPVDRVRLARLLARLQREAAGRLADSGAPELSLDDFVNALSALSSSAELRACVGDSTAAQLARQVPSLRRVVARLRVLGDLPPVLVHGGGIVDNVVLAFPGHGDLHDTHRPHGRYQLVDWKHAFIGHPFCDLADLVHNEYVAHGAPGAEAALRADNDRVVHAYLDELRLNWSIKTMRHMLCMAFVVWKVARLLAAVSIYRAAQHLARVDAGIEVNYWAREVSDALHKVAPLVGPLRIRSTSTAGSESQYHAADSVDAGLAHGSGDTFGHESASPLSNRSDISVAHVHELDDDGPISAEFDSASMVVQAGGGGKDDEGWAPPTR